MDEQDKRVIAQFTAQSRYFNSNDYSLSSREYLGWAVERMPLNEGMRVLDVAAGTGLLSFAVSAYVKSVTAVDITEAMLEEGRKASAKKEIANVTFKSANAYDLSAERGYDIAMSRLAFHHLTRPKDVLKQMIKTVGPGGGVIVLDIVSPDEEKLAGAYNHYERLRDDSHVRALTEHELIHMFHANGLCDINIFQRSVINELEAWMNMTDTADDTRHTIREAVRSELMGGEKTGLSPFAGEDGTIKFIHQWVMITGKTGQ